MKKGDNLRILSGAQTKAVECYAVEQGMTFRPYGKCGTACAEVIRDEVLHRLSGKNLGSQRNGENGGDGFVVAENCMKRG